MRLYFSILLTLLFGLSLNAQTATNSWAQQFISSSFMVNISDAPNGVSLVNNSVLNSDKFQVEIPAYSLMSIITYENLYNKYQVVEKPKNIIPRESTVTKKEEYIPYNPRGRNVMRSHKYRVPRTDTDVPIYRTVPGSSKKMFDAVPTTNYILKGLSGRRN